MALPAWCTGRIFLEVKKISLSNAKAGEPFPELEEYRSLAVTTPIIAPVRSRSQSESTEHSRCRDPRALPSPTRSWVRANLMSQSEGARRGVGAAVFRCRALVLLSFLVCVLLLLLVFLPSLLHMPTRPPALPHSSRMQLPLLQESSSLPAPLPHPPPSDDDGLANSDDDPMAVLAPSSLHPDPFLHALVLTQEQVLHRRASRLRHVLRIYRAQYWGLLEEMRSKYRRFYLRHGKSGWRREPGPGPNGPARDDHDLPPGEMKRPHAPESPGGSDLAHCGAQGCLAKPLLLSSYCYTHILQEPRQRLYKPCSFIVRRGIGKNANVVCQKPVLQALSPPLCPTHFQQTQKQSARSLRKAGIVLPAGPFSKSAPKLHHFVAEYVRVIQLKRRAHRIAQGRGETSVASRREVAQGLGTGTSKQGALQRNIYNMEIKEQRATGSTRAGEASSKPIVV